MRPRKTTGRLLMSGPWLLFPFQEITRAIIAGERGRIQPTTNGSVRKTSQPGFGVRGRLTFQVRFSKLPESSGAFAMRSPNEFWIALHDLTTATHAEGDSLDQRQRNIYYTLVQMPPIAQQEVLDELAENGQVPPRIATLHSPDGALGVWQAAD